MSDTKKLAALAREIEKMANAGHRGGYRPDVHYTKLMPSGQLHYFDQEGKHVGTGTQHDKIHFQWIPDEQSRKEPDQVVDPQRFHEMVMDTEPMHLKVPEHHTKALKSKPKAPPPAAKPPEEPKPETEATQNEGSTESKPNAPAPGNAPAKPPTPANPATPNNPAPSTPVKPEAKPEDKKDGDKKENPFAKKDEGKDDKPKDDDKKDEKSDDKKPEDKKDDKAEDKKESSYTASLREHLAAPADCEHCGETKPDVKARSYRDDMGHTETEDLCGGCFTGVKKLIQRRIERIDKGQNPTNGEPMK